MEILIAGAGIGGLALARGLLADGHAVRVLEAAAGPRTGGAAVTVYSNGAAALHGLGAPLPDGLGGRIDALEIRDARGRRVSRMDLTVMRRATGFPVTTVPRERLTAHLATGVPIAFGRRVESAAPDGTVVVGGETLRADVVVGADGARSAIRAAIRSTRPAEVGWTTFQGLTPVLPRIAAGHEGVLLVGAAGLVGLMPAGDGLTQWWFDVRGDDFDPARFRDYAEPVPELLADLDGLSSFPHLLHEVPHVWGAGRVTLLGDAAHVFPPSQAQGANQALEDAWALRRTLAGDGDLRAYEHLRTIPVRRVSRMAASERTNRPAGPLTRALARLVPAGLAGRGYASLIRRCSTVL
ncbi:NAD(P)/FAD-dependent oxidoreductase [Dactylosporangium sp. NPDC000244]|uniref:FAD-dependent oxidoreductase n=1 Tax=Dactylosporangium sp. NPDC000244 TaxID=3154365 RepID=UPI00332C2F1F